MLHKIFQRAIIVSLLLLPAEFSKQVTFTDIESAFQKDRQVMYNINDYISADGDKGKTALIQASCIGQVKSVNELLATGVDANARISDGTTALILAAEQGHINIVRLLVKHGADINAKSKRGWTALVASTIRNYPELVQFLLEQGATVDVEPRYMEMPLLAIASMYGRAEIVKMLLQAGCDVDTKDDEGNTPLMRAASGDEDSVTGGDLATVVLLLHRGAKVNIANNRGWTALMCAASNGDFHLDILKTLLAAGAEVRVKNIDEWTPLMLAAFGGNDKMVLELLKHGADVNATNKEGKTAFSYAVENGHTYVSEILRNAGAK